MKPIPTHHFRRVLLIAAVVGVYVAALNVNSIMYAEDPAVQTVSGTPPENVNKFTPDELRKLVAPIALYPDALVSQILPASTYPLQIVSAYRHVQSSSIPTQPPPHANWDSSIVALLNYPTVLKKLNDDLDWTERLGLAVTYQMNEVSDMIQQVRAEARAAGNLPSNDKQVFVQEQNIIRIVSADPAVIYVPTYDPDVIFIAHDSWQPYFSFSIGFAVGVWLDNYWDWRYHHFSRRHIWYPGGWFYAGSPIYWNPPYRPVPPWFRRNPPGPPVTGYRQGTYAPRVPPSHPQQPGRPNLEPNRPHAPSAPVPPGLRPNRPQGPAEGLGRTGYDNRRDANRGLSSRLDNRAPYTPPAGQPPKPYIPPQQNVLRPSDGQRTRIESNRGANSRGGSTGLKHR